jgi:hypothetical protein
MQATTCNFDFVEIILMVSRSDPQLQKICSYNVL